MRGFDDAIVIVLLLFQNLRTRKQATNSEQLPYCNKRVFLCGEKCTQNLNQQRTDLPFSHLELEK